MNREQRRANGLTGKPAILTITQEELDQHMPHVKDGDLVQITVNDEPRVMRVEVIEKSGNEPSGATDKPMIVEQGE